MRLWSGVQRRHDRSSAVDQLDQGSPQGTEDPDRLHVSVRLAAFVRDGAIVTSDRDDFGISTQRRGVGLPAIEDSINQMLGRDPEQHRPPRLAWGQLIDALADAGVTVSEQELISAPLTIELAPEVKGQFADTPS